MKASATKEAAAQAPTKARIPATGNQLSDDSSGEDSEGNPEVPIWDLGVQTDGGGGQVSLNVIRSHLMGESEEEEALSPRPADTILTTTLHIANVLANLGDQATRLATAPTGGNFWVSPTRQRHEKSQDDFDAGVREGQFEESSRLPQHAKVCGCPRPLFQSYLWKTPDSSAALPPARHARDRCQLQKWGGHGHIWCDGGGNADGSGARGVARKEEARNGEEETRVRS